MPLWLCFSHGSLAPRAPGLIVPSPVTGRGSFPIGVRCGLLVLTRACAAGSQSAPQRRGQGSWRGLPAQGPACLSCLPGCGAEPRLWRPRAGLSQAHAASGWYRRSGRVLYRPREAQLISCQGSYYGGITEFTGPGNRVMGLLTLNGGDS